jgi:hypothetical protein
VNDPYGLLLWEQIGCIADDERRLEAFRALETRLESLMAENLCT